MSACKWAGSEQPRELPNGDPCPEAHCLVCGHRHVDELTCPACIGSTRDDLAEVARLDMQLLTEAIHRGVESEAAMLEGAVADANAWRQRRRYGYRDHADDRLGENAPLWVLGTWDLLVTEHYGHTRTRRVTVPSAAKYLASNLTELAQDGDFAFEDLARGVRQCRAHLEAVLHDGEQRDTGAPCMTCGVPLERVWGSSELGDGWRCPRCREKSTEDQYRFAVAHLHREEADHLTDRDMEIRTGVKAATVRKWAERGQVRRRLDSGRVLYDVSDVERNAGIADPCVSQ